jgi:hypothetical protein
MATYYAYVVLGVNEFEANGEEDAVRKIDEYVTSLSAVTSLAWDEADWKIVEAESGDVVVPFYKEVYN